MTSPRPALALRTVLELLLALGAVYVVGSAAIISLVISPAARSLRGDTRELVAARQTVRRQQARMVRASAEIRGAARRAPAAGLDPATVDRLQAPVRGSLDTVSATAISSTLADQLEGLRVPLARATENETAAGLALLGAAAALEAGSPERAGDLLDRADSLLDLTAVDLEAVQNASLDDLLEREGRLVEATGLITRAFLAWAAIGIALAIVASILLRRRLIRPIAALEDTVTRIASGDLAAVAPVGRDDELGHLARHVNAMTEVLRERAALAQLETEAGRRERDRLAGQLARAERLDSIGRLAGGVAHDFNNLLTAILGYLDAVRRSLPVAAPEQADLAEIERAALRAADLTRQLLTFARRQMVEPRVVDVNELIRHAERLLRRLIGADIELVTRLDPALGPVRVDPAQFEQVIVNLVVNAREAMPAGGRIEIDTGNVALGGEPVGEDDLATGDYVEIRVADDGHGMDQETLGRLFEPFFTTKALGRGTGLGLATSYGFVRQAGGHIKVTSEPGRGSVFSVRLPRFAGPAGAAGEAGFDRRLAGDLPVGRETVLVVEDEPQVRALVDETLRELGYTVRTAADGEAAIAIGGEELARIDLLLTDLILPRVGGREVVAALRASRPDLPVIYMSGAPGGTARPGPLEDALLSKPFTRAELARKVRATLDPPRRRNGP